MKVLYQKSVFLISLLLSLGINGMEKEEEIDYFSHLPNEIMLRIAGCLTEKDNGAALRQTSKRMKAIVDQSYGRYLKTCFGNHKEAPLIDVLTEPKDVPFFKIKYINNIMKNVSKEHLEKDGYLFVPQGSLLEGFLTQNYKSIPLYSFLQNQPEATQILFKKLFNKDIPENSYNLALNLLTGCLPVNHIYVEKNKTEEEGKSLLKIFQNVLSERIQNNNRDYFLLGIDQNFEVLDDDEGHIVVMNQSNLEDLPRLPEEIETVIFNADQEVLRFDRPEQGIKNIILTNGNQRCKTIAENFLWLYRSLQSIDCRGLTGVQTIEDEFFSECTNLQSIDCRGLTGVETVGDFFFYACKLESFDSQGLTNLHSTGGNFFGKCTNLKSFDSRGLTNVKTVGSSFFCHTNIKSFDSRGLKSVETVGDFFFYDSKLESFDSQGLTNVQAIGDHFLHGCEDLKSFDSRGLTKVETIGDDFLYGCYKLESFDSHGLTNLHTIRNHFFQYCSGLKSFDSRGLTGLTFIGNGFFYKCFALESFDSRDLNNVKTIGNNFFGFCKKFDGEKIKKELLERSSSKK